MAAQGEMSPDGRRRGRGQSLVEFALTLPMVLVMLMGIVDLGFVLYAHIQVAAAAAEGARVGSLVFVNTVVNNPDQSDNDNARRTAVLAAVDGAMGRLERTLPSFSVGGSLPQSPTVPFVGTSYEPNLSTPDTRSGADLVVTVRYNQRTLFNFLPGLVHLPQGDYWLVSNTARMRIR